MTIKPSSRVLVGLGLLIPGLLVTALPGRAEELHYKFYTWAVQAERVPIGDVEGHTVALTRRSAFYVFDNGEVATIQHVSTGDYIQGAGPFMQYVTIKFPDGATILIKSQGTMGAGGASGNWTSEILKGTGRFEGIKGTQSAKATYLPTEPGEAGAKGYGEGTITYTLPPK